MSEKPDTKKDVEDSMKKSGVDKVIKKQIEELKKLERNGK